jgi:hypothetical protein
MPPAAQKKIGDQITTAFPLASKKATSSANTLTKWLYEPAPRYLIIPPEHYINNYSH